MRFALKYPLLRRFADGLIRVGHSDARTTADRRLAQRIAEALDVVDLPHVESASLYVKDAGVTVFGLVGCEEDRRFVEEVLRRIHGVRRVESRLNVIPLDELAAFRAAETV